MKVKIITVASVVMLIAACSGSQAYYGTRSSQQNQCQSIADKLEYEQCMQDSQMSYEEYQERLKN